ncbi:MAG: NepR family anti-sigma factor [Sphingomonadales bacterium]|jgi:hypothetical protein
MNPPRKMRLADRPGDPAATPARPARGAARADPISAGLRALWSAMESEPVPGDFLDLLDRMDAQAAESDAPPPRGPAA